ncbi:MAG: hypothetical protein KatS3mg105_0384 [Gemmatales bacterium]|nr:MAG: hypothetical protein KatS3mg105_0384 [Gemmatales bacterium]
MYLTLKVHEATIGAEMDQLEYARTIIRTEAEALQRVASRLDQSFLEAVDLIHHCRGRIVVTGTGKSADVGQKIAGTLNSTGTRAYVLDSTRAVHGDLGMVHPDDVALVLSYSGESEEIVRLLPPLKRLAHKVIALTGAPQSTLARMSDVVLYLGPLEEACPLGLAPSTSTTAMIAVGDALAFVLSRLRRFSREDFAQFHPAGSLGRKLLAVEAIMRQGNELRLAPAKESVREVFTRVRQIGRRSGAILLTHDDGTLAGIFTDSDLARLFEQRRDDAFDRPIAEVMTQNPITIEQGRRVEEAVTVMKQRKISELPVLDASGRPVGLLDITDVIGLFPVEEESAISQVA